MPNPAPRRSLSYGLVVWSLAATFYLYEFILRVSPNVMLADIVRDYHIKAAAMGIMASGFYWAYALMQLPVGVLVDKYPAKRLLLLGLGLVVLGTAIFANAHWFVLGFLGRILIGLGSAFAFLCTIKLTIEWFDPKRFAFFAGATNVFGYVGASLGGQPLHALLQHYSWNTVLNGFVLFGLALAAVIFLVIKDRGIDKQQAPLRYQTQASGRQNIASVIRNKQSWFNGFYILLMVAPTSTFAALWGATYLHHVYGISNNIAATATMSIFIGVACGSPVFGWVSDTLKSRKMPLIVAAIGAFIITCWILYFSHANAWLLFSLCFLFGVCQSGHNINFAVAKEVNRRHACGTAIGFTNMMLVLGGAIFQPLVGILLQWHSHIPMTHAGSTAYATSDFHFALMALPICQFLAILISIFCIKESFPGDVPKPLVHGFEA